MALFSGNAQATNLALGKTMTASGTSFGTPSLAVDGVVAQASYWQGAGSASTLTVDLGSTQNVNQVYIRLPLAWGDRTQTFSVLGSTDNVTYSPLVASATYAFKTQWENMVGISFGAANVQYVRLSFTANSVAGSGQVAELEVFGNLANGKTIVASSTSYGTPAQAIDGVVAQTSYWQAAGSGPSTLTVDLGSPQSVDQVTLKLPPAWTSRNQVFSILGSTDNVNFSTLAASATYVFRASNANVVEVAFAPMSARYVRLGFTGNSGAGSAQVSEFEIYGGKPSFARAKSITANASSVGTTPALANDGVVAQSSYWQGTGSYPNTITVDLGDVIGANSVNLKLPTAWGSRTQTFSILGSQDNTTFTTILPSTVYSFNSAAGNVLPIYFPVVNARYIRLVFTANSGAGSGQVSEFEVFGSSDFLDTAPMQVLSWQISGGVLSVTTTGGILKLQPFLDQALHVQFGTSASLAAATSYTVTRAPDTIAATASETATDVVLTAPQYTVKVAKATTQVSIFNAAGTLLLKETATGARTSLAGSTGNISDRFELTPSEALYGLGQFRDNAMNLRGVTRTLAQKNTQAAVPVVLSTNGWSMFWDNPSSTTFTDSSSGMSFASSYGDSLNFYVVFGPSLDELVRGYRRLTGTAPMLPYWAFGYHQSRNRYATQSQLLTTASQMRTSSIPMDSIFIDYQYWGASGCGSHVFDASAWPNVPSMLQQLHAQNTKVILSVWPAFKVGIPNYNSMNSAGYLLTGGVSTSQGVAYDAFNPGARTLYWNQIASSLVPLGFDGWFLDGPEPEGGIGTTTFDGPGGAVESAYPLLHVSTFCNGLLSALPNQRTYIITRCAWAAQQRNGMTIWSGDINGTFAELKTQIAAGLNYVASGLPYWTTDIGGYNGGATTDPSYQELFTRWWEYGVFCPIFRSHGLRQSGTTNELWQYGATVQTNCTRFDTLRYRLLPYVYSLAGKVTQDSYTPMRLLAFDFASDTAVRNIKDQFMYGPAYLINPITVAGATSRSLYLPAGTSWIDFWTGATLSGGQTIAAAAAPIDRIPIYARAGSIVPMGPAMQYTTQSSPTPIEVRIYPGANGTFTLYEDDGSTLNYQTGAFAQIPFTWNEATQSLTIGARSGSFSGMLTSRTFHIVWVRSNGTGSGIDAAVTPDATVTYTGTQQAIVRPPGAF